MNMRRSQSRLLIGALCAVVLTGCAQTRPGMGGAGGCVPLVSVQPQTVVAGDTITVTIAPGCNPETPADGWMIIGSPVGNLDAAVRTPLAADFADGLEVELQLPASFPSGPAFAGVDEWDFSSCADNESCAGPTTDFVVAPNR